MQANDFSISGDGWNAVFDEKTPAFMRFEIEGESFLELIPVSFGTISESSGIQEKCRMHESADGFSCSAEIKTLLPFGAEPTIERNIEFAGNHAKITTDIKTAGKFSADEFSVDNLFLPGKWDNIRIIEIPEAHIIPSGASQKLSQNGKTVYDSEKPFLTIVLESEERGKLELGTGDDLWRWMAAERNFEEAKASFSIEDKDNGILISRKILTWEEESEMPTQNWRFKWYFSWEKAEDSKQAEKAGSEMDFLKFKLPESAKTVHDGNVRKEICFAAHITQKRMKKWIRAEASKHDGINISIKNLIPHICESAAHLERAKKKELLHWDIMKIFDFWLWANKQLAKSNSSLSIETDPTLELPSLKGLL
jgi:hypothetical protein